MSWEPIYHPIRHAPFDDFLDPDFAYRQALDEAKEIGLQLDSWHASRTLDKEQPWIAVALWPEERDAYERWQAGDPDDLGEPPEVKESWARGRSRAEAAWRAIERACDG